MTVVAGFPRVRQPKLPMVKKYVSGTRKCAKYTYCSLRATVLVGVEVNIVLTQLTGCDCRLLSCFSSSLRKNGAIFTDCWAELNVVNQF